MSLRKRILNWMEAHGQWIHKGEIARHAEEVGFMGETCGRRLRELYEDGFLLREERLNANGLKSVWYKFKKEGGPEYKIIPQFIERDRQIIVRLNKIKI